VKGASGPEIVPLILGITGHRDLRTSDVPELERRVGLMLEALRAEMPTTPFVLLSPLAEGADRLVARVALARGARLVAPLPLPVAEYERDFPESLDEFRELLARADHFELPAGAADGDAVRDPAGPSRKRAYARCGAYIAQHCHVLIALWGGVTKGPETELEGGTAQVVRFHREGVHAPLMPPGYPPDPVDRGPTWHVVTPRRSSDVPARVGEGHAEPWLDLPPTGLPEAEARDLQQRIRVRIERYNAEIVAARARGEVPGDATALVPHADAPSVPDVAQATARRFAAADALASRWQRRTVEALWWVPIGALVALVPLEIFADWHERRGWLLAHAVLAVSIYVAWRLRVQRPAIQDRYQDYRALAEALRVEFFWQVAGIGVPAAERYLGSQRTELDWIRLALRAFTTCTPEARRAALAPPASATTSRIELAQRHWIDAQASWFAAKARASEKWAHRWDRAIEACFLVSMATTASALALMFLLRGELAVLVSELLERHAVHEGLVAFIAAPGVIAALLEYRATRRAHAEHARQYERMAQEMDLVKRRVEALLRAGRTDDARDQLLHAGEQALVENGDWVLLHRSRPVNVPHAG